MIGFLALPTASSLLYLPRRRRKRSAEVALHATVRERWECGGRKRPGAEPQWLLSQSVLPSCHSQEGARTTGLTQCRPTLAQQIRHSQAPSVVPMFVSCVCSIVNQPHMPVRMYLRDTERLCYMKTLFNRLTSS